MDLIREELLRQTKALEALLLGTEERAEAVPLPEVPWQRAATSGEERTSPAMLAGGQRPSEEDQTSGGTWEHGSEMAAGVWPTSRFAGQTSPAGEWVARAPWESWQGVPVAQGAPGEGAPGEAAPGDGAPAIWRQAQPAASGGTPAPVDAGENRLVTEYILAGRTPGTGAREMSRLFERDARRYDGGFTT